MALARVPVTVTFRRADIQPPVFVAGSYSSPPWTPEEMECADVDDGEHLFHKEVLAEPGSRFQYKFRIGTGDWWVLDEQSPAMADDSGNLNNEMIVLEPSVPEPESPAPADDLEEQPALSPTREDDEEPDSDIDDETGDLSLADLEDRMAAYYKKDGLAVHDVSAKRGPPLFPHECMFNDGTRPDESHAEEDKEHPSPERFPPVTQTDLKDPGLVEFPSDRNEIIDVVRRMSSASMDDEAVILEARPFAPAIRMPLKKTREDEEPADWAAESHLQPDAASVIPRPGKHLDVPKSPDSVSSARSSPLSLQSISEVEEEEDSSEAPDSPLLRKAHPEAKPDFQAPPNGSDGAQARGPEESEAAGDVHEESKPQTPVQHSVENGDGEGLGIMSEAAPVPSLPAGEEAAEHAETNSRPTANGDAQDEGLQKPTAEAVDAVSTGRDAGAASQGLSRRPGAAGADESQVTTPTQPTPTGMQAHREGGNNWLTAFLRTILVEWLGGIISRLYGGKRKT